MDYSTWILQGSPDGLFIQSGNYTFNGTGSYFIPTSQGYFKSSNAIFSLVNGGIDPVEYFFAPPDSVLASEVCDVIQDWIDDGNVPSSTPTATPTSTPSYVITNFIRCCDELVFGFPLRSDIYPVTQNGFVYDGDCYYYVPAAQNTDPVQVINFLVEDLESSGGVTIPYCNFSKCACITPTPTVTQTHTLTPTLTETTPLTYIKINPKSCCDDTYPFTDGLYINSSVNAGGVGTSDVFVYNGTEYPDLVGKCFEAIYDPNVNPTEYIVVDQNDLAENCEGCSSINADECPTPTPTHTPTITLTPDICDDQDIVFLIDQSWSVGNQSNFDHITDGIISIANSFETKMDSGDVQLAAYKWSSCSVDKIELISDLTSSHDDFVTSISGTSWDGGNTSASKPLELAYNLLSGSSNTNAVKNIVLITDGVLSDFDTVPSCLELDDPIFSSSQIISLMKIGQYGNGEKVKIFTAGISTSTTQLKSLSSGADFEFESESFEDFENTTSSQIYDSICQNLPQFGSTSYWRADSCCGSNSIIVAYSGDPGSNEGFIYGGLCYTIVGLQSSDSTPDHVILESDIIEDVCDNDGTCGCNLYEYVILEDYGS